MAKYIVNVIMSACVEVEVEAHNEEEARALAIEEADPYMAMDDDWDYKVDCAFRDWDDDEGEEEEDWEEE